MLKSILFLGFTLLCQLVNAQFGNVWPLGKMQGIDFNGPQAKLIKTGINNDSVTIPRRPSECHITAISDCNGKMLFYSNGLDIWNKKDTIMDNGRLQYIDRGSGGALNRNCLIIPIPESSNLYYLFTMVYLGKDIPANGFYMSLIDMSQNGGLGKVLFKDSLLNSGILPSTNLTYAKHANDTDIWLLVSKNNTQVYSFLISKNGIATAPVVSNISTQIVDRKKVFFRHGYIKMTNNHAKLIVTGIESRFNSNGHVLSYDFNRKTGVLNNEQSIIAHNTYKEELIISMAFSPNDTFIYFSLEPDSGYTGKDFCRILQYNQFTKAKSIIKKFQRPLGWTGFPIGILGLQTGPDGKTYLFIYNKIYRINFPNRKGTACNLTYWDSLQFMDYSYNHPNSSIYIYSLPNIYMPQRKLYFNSSTDADPCTDTTVLTYRGDTTFYKLVWHFGDGDSLIQTQPIKYGSIIKHVYLQDGKYEITLRSWHAVCNSKKSYSDTIEVRLKPSFTHLQKDTPVHACFSDTIGLNYQCKSGDILRIDWGDNSSSSLNINDALIHNIRKTYYQEKSYKLQYKLSASNLCFIQKTDSFKAVFNPKPILDLKADGYQSLGSINNKPEYKGCEPMVLNFKDNSGQFKSFKINWYHGDSILSYVDSIGNVVFNNSAGLNATNGLNTFQATNTYNCTSSDTFYTKVYGRPIAGFNLDTPWLCLRNNLFNVANTTQYKGFADSLKYKFEWGDGTNLSDFPLSGHTFNRIGKFDLNQIVAGEFACADTFARSLNIFPHPDATFDILKDVQCLNENDFEVMVQSNDAYWFNWGDGNVNPFLTMTQGQMLNHRYTGPGEFNITGIAKNVYQCSDTLSKDVHVKPHPNVDFSLNDTSACINMNQFTVSTSISYPDMDSVSSVIYFGDGWTYKQPKGNFTKNYTYIAEGTFQIKLVSKSNYDCLDSIERRIEVFPQPTVNLSTSDVCLGDSVIFSADWNLIDKVTKISWVSPEVNLTEIQVNSGINRARLARLYSNDGLYTMKFAATNEYACKSEIAKMVRVFPLPVADFDYVKLESTPGNISYQFYDKSNSALGWDWSFAQEGKSSLQNPFFAFSDTGYSKVILRITDNNLCSDSAYKILMVFPDFDFHFPNAISLNYDLLNETFGTNAAQFIKDYELEIYNRWGQLIYKTNDKFQDWQPDLEGVYLYKIKIKDLFLKLHFYSGTVTVLK